jgi:hypothetical protein
MIDTVAVVTVITLVVVTITVTAIAIAALQKTKQRVYKGTCHLTTDASITQFDNILRSSIFISFHILSPFIPHLFLYKYSNT